jgi:outer membrane protein assembly factor BamB
VVWQSADLADYAMIDMIGAPLLADGKLYIAGKTQPNPQQQRQPPRHLVMAIRPYDGKLLWKTDVASSRQGQPMYFYYRPDNSPQPRLLLRSGAVYLDTHVGILGRLDAESGALEWGYGYKTAPAQSQSRFFFYEQSDEPKVASTPPLQAGDAFLVKGVESGRLEAIDPNTMKVLWERPVTKASRLLGADDRNIYMGGAELSAIDPRTRELKWATRVPGGSMDSRVLVRPEGIWQLTSRGIFEVDPRLGDIRRIFRGKDLGSIGGDLFLTEPFLVAVSNRTISAYPRRDPAPAVSPPAQAASARAASPGGALPFKDQDPKEKASR